MTEDFERQDAEQGPDEFADAEMEVDADADDSSAPAMDWGLKKPKSGMGKEIKIGVAILALIGVIFGYVIYKKSGDSHVEVAEAQDDSKQEPSPPAEPKKADPAQDLAAKKQTAAASPQRLVGHTTPAANARPAAGQLFEDESSLPPQAPAQQRDSYNDLLAEADAIRDARAAATAAADPAVEDQWENLATDDRIAGQMEPAADEFRDLPPDQGEEFADIETTDLTSLDGDVNPYAETSNTNTFDESALADAEPAADPFSQDDVAVEPLGDEDFASEPDFSDNEDLGAAPLEEFQDVSISQDASEYQEPTGTPGAQASGSVEITDVTADTESGQGEYADPRTGQFHNVTQHTGRASSTTIVQRSDDSPLEAETAFDEMAPTQSRVDGYRTVESFQNEIADDRRAADTEEFAEQLAEDTAALDDVSLAGTADNVTQSPGTDNRTYGFDSPRQGFDQGPQDFEQPVQEFEQDSRADEAFAVKPRVHGPVHIVEANDSFWSIARQAYGDPKYFQALAKYNEGVIPDPKFMKPGLRVETPPAAKLEGLYPELFGQVQQASQSIATDAAPFDNGEWLNEDEFRGRVGYGTGETISRAAAQASGFFLAADGQPQYRVISGDNLGAIARRHLGKASRWEEIYQLNKDRLIDPNRLKIGTVLRLPDDARREEVVTRPEFGR